MTADTTYVIAGASLAGAKPPRRSAMLCPASHCAKIHATCGAVRGSGSSRCARRPQGHQRLWAIQLALWPGLPQNQSNAMVNLRSRSRIRNLNRPARPRSRAGCEPPGPVQSPDG
jgi:hypothetical protein